MPASPRVFCLNGKRLLEARARVAAGDAVLKPALDRLVREADEALGATAPSVMDKTTVPLSGDKHDYMSVGPYWWPDPDKTDGLPYIRRDGEVNPQRQANTTDARAMGRMIGSVETLALAWWLTGRGEYAQHATAFLRTWFLAGETRMNANLEYGQAIPGVCDGRGVGIIDTVGLPRLVDVVGLLGGADAWTDDDQAGLVAWFEAYLDWLLTSPHGLREADAHNNHGTWYDAQVASFALFVGREERARRTVRAARARRIDTQIEPDGSQPHELKRTKSFDYSVYNLTALLNLATMGRGLGVDLWRYESPNGAGIRSAVDFLARYADGDEDWLAEQITPLRRVTLLPVLRRAALAYGDGRYGTLTERLPADEVAGDRAQLLWPP